MTHSSSVDLYWLPLGAGGRSVAFNGRAFEALVAARERRSRAPLFHSALEVRYDRRRFTIEMAPVWNTDAPERGVVREGPVGAMTLARWRWFRYEVRRWEDGVIPDAEEAVNSPLRLSDNDDQASEVLAKTQLLLPLTWGRDELQLGEMWNSNSVTSWLLSATGHDLSTVSPPHLGRAPGWAAGVALASRQRISSS